MLNDTFRWALFTHSVMPLYITITIFFLTVYPSSLAQEPHASFEIGTIHWFSSTSFFSTAVCPIPSSLICALLPSGVYACFFYSSNHWAQASLKLIELETCPPEETLTLSIKEISDSILSIRSKDCACVFDTDIQSWVVTCTPVHLLKLLLD